MSDDLISRKALIADMKSRKYIDKALCEIFETVVDEAPTAFDKEKVMNEIKEYKEDAEKWANKSIENADEFSTYVDAYKNCLDIVEKGGIE